RKRGGYVGDEEADTWVWEQQPGSARGEASVTPGLKFGREKWMPAKEAEPERSQGSGREDSRGQSSGMVPASRSARLSLLECPALLLLLSLLLLSLGLPVLGAPPRLICDSRVLERYILEAREAENATVGCAEGCSFSENITVPDTKVNFHAWKRMEVQQQAVEVWQGLALLSEAILQGQALLANSSQPSEALQLHVDKAVSGLRSLTSLLRALGAQVQGSRPPSRRSLLCSPPPNIHY
ncbi:hypothetical protein E2I00_014913, partial [Balaenoptera physalus]